MELMISFLIQTFFLVSQVDNVGLIINPNRQDEYIDHKKMFCTREFFSSTSFGCHRLRMKTNKLGWHFNEVYQLITRF
jgi:hypothetical protein